MILESEEESFLSPIYLGFIKPRDGYAAASDLFVKACRAVPPVKSYRKRSVDRRQVVSEPHSREVVSYKGIEGQSLNLARCVDRGPNESDAQASVKWQWEVALTEMKTGTYAPFIPDGLSVYLIEVTRFRLTKGAVRDTAQLALFRSIFIQFLRTLDPSLVVVGGQHDWQNPCGHRVNTLVDGAFDEGQGLLGQLSKLR